MKIATILHTATTKSEEIVGTSLGTVAGFVAHRTFSDVIVTFLIAIGTGFLGAFGTYLFKLFKAKFLTGREHTK